MDRLDREIRTELGRFGPVVGIGSIAEAWPAAVGDAIAANAWPARVARDGTLVVHTRDSVWAFELSQRQEEIRERLGETAPPRLRFVVGPVPEPGVDTAPQQPAEVPEPGVAEVAKGAELAAGIEDEELREQVARAAALSLARAAADRGFW